MTQAEHGRLAQETQFRSTSEVAAEIRVKQQTLQFWVREGLLRPRSSGEGRQRRLSWSAEDIEQARQLARSGGKAGVAGSVEAEVGAEFLAGFSRGQSLRGKASRGQITIAGASGARLFRDDATIREVLKTIPGGLLVVLP